MDRPITTQCLGVQSCTCSQKHLDQLDSATNACDVEGCVTLCILLCCVCTKEEQHSHHFRLPSPCGHMQRRLTVLCSHVDIQPSLHAEHHGLRLSIFYYMDEELAPISQHCSWSHDPVQRICINIMSVCGALSRAPEEA